VPPKRILDEGHGRGLRRVAYSPSSLRWTCCCCWNMGRACSAADRSRGLLVLRGVCGVETGFGTTPIFVPPTRHNKDPDRRYKRGRNDAIPSLDQLAEGTAGKCPARSDRAGLASRLGIQCRRASVPPRAFPTAISEIGSWPQTNFLATLESGGCECREGVATGVT
jgi:hypothetical protein